MASSEQKRQKKLAKHQSRAKKAKRDLARKKQELSSMAGKMRLACRFPIFDCKISDLSGPRPYLTHVILARRIAGGEVAMASFLLDCGCLGVKDAFGRYCTLGEYHSLLEKCQQEMEMVDASAERARALIDQAVAYAAELGFAPHADFHKAYALFGDVAASQCSEVFPMGDEEGKPTYIAGPHEDAARQRAILAQLTARLGEGNFNYLIAVPPSGSRTVLVGDEDDEDYIEDDFIDEVEDYLEGYRAPADDDEGSAAPDDIDATDWRRLEPQ